jgi:hypothetical protein
MERIQQIEALIRQIEATADPGTRAGVRELVEAILEYHGAGLSRILEIIVAAGAAGEAVIREIARDPLAASLLLLYGLHPEDFETRVRRAVDRLQGVDLVGITEGFVRLRALQASAISREAIEQAIYAVAPETAGLEIEGAHAAAAFVPLGALQRTL